MAATNTSHCGVRYRAATEAFRRDNPNAEGHLYDTGHFALETHVHQIAAVMRDFLGRGLEA